jgi:FAD/FMN-containing dehydrogenase
MEGASLRSSFSQPVSISTAQLRAQVGGRVITPDDPAYDQARTIFYAGFDRRPQVIVQAAGHDDVARVVTLARETGLELAVRSGGHSPAGHSVVEGGSCWTLGPCARSISTWRHVPPGPSRA